MASRITKISANIYIPYINGKPHHKVYYLSQSGQKRNKSFIATIPKRPSTTVVLTSLF